MKKVLFGLGAFAVVVSGLVLSAPEGRADDILNAVKYRVANMKALGGHMGALAAIAKGEVPFTAHAAGHGASVAAIGKITGELFPDGSDMGETRALPAIWEEPGKFAQAVKAFEAESAKLAEVAASGDLAALGAQLGAVGKTCGGCHKPFRKEKN